MEDYYPTKTARNKGAETATREIAPLAKRKPFKTATDLREVLRGKSTLHATDS
jgi:hypothetical protein